MKITIITIGSRGDIQPFLALSVGLNKAGHQVTLATHQTFAELIQSYGINFYPLEGNPQEWLESEAGKQKMMESAKNPLQFFSLFAEAVNPMIEELIAGAWVTCQNADVVISHSITTWSHDLAKKLNIPYIMASFVPLFANSQYPISLTNGKSLGGLFNYLSYPVSQLIFWQLFRNPTNQWLKSHLDITPHPIWEYPTMRMNRDRVPFLYAYSSHILPRPNNWPARVHITGNWYLESEHNWQPPQQLIDFLDSGKPPIYIGFGSMQSRDPERITEIALQALTRNNQRGILLTGWGGISNVDLPDHVLKIDSVPHDCLFPRCAGIVHHGGAGTTAAGLKAGVPVTIVPFLGDQPFWGNRLASLGVATQPILQQDLTVDSLSDAIATITSNQAMIDKAKDLGTKIRAEDGVGNAVKVVEQYVNQN